MSTIQPVKGTRDFFPDDMAFRQWLYANIRAVSERFGYEEYDGPFLERLELYAAKSGEELVKEQSFVFPDRGGEMIALRPELTPSLARMVAKREQALLRPIRWWSFGPFWRYERPQKGRSREFFQWNIDLLGIESAEADAEIAAIAAEFMNAVGLGPEAVRILVNDRRLADSQLDQIGIAPERRSQVFRIIDRRERMSSDDWSDWARKQGLDEGEFQGLRAALEDREAWRASEPLRRFFDASEALGVSDYLEYDPSVIRGLDYYTGTVFEARDVAGEFRAILGGGRYDNLISELGGNPVPGTGFAMGDMVLRLVLEKYDAIPNLEAPPSSVLVTTFDPPRLGASLELATELRREGISAEWYPIPDKLGKQLKYADRLAIPVAVVLGPDEIAAGTVTLRDLRSGDQQTVDRKSLLRAIGALIGAPA